MSNKEVKELTPEEVKARREYYRNWRQKNKDKVKHYNSTFWLKKAHKKHNGK